MGSGASFDQIKTFIFTNFHVKKSFSDWVDHMLKQMMRKGEVKKLGVDRYYLVKIPHNPPVKDPIFELYHGEGSQEVLTSHKPLKGSVCKGKTSAAKNKPPPSTYLIRYRNICKERLGKECFTCGRKGCTECRKSPDEIHRTSQTLWARAIREEEYLIKEARKKEGSSNDEKKEISSSSDA